MPVIGPGVPTPVRINPSTQSVNFPLLRSLVLPAWSDHGAPPGATP
jgi:hypothetical protein